MWTLDWIQTLTLLKPVTWAWTWFSFFWIPWFWDELGYSCSGLPACGLNVGFLWLLCLDCLASAPCRPSTEPFLRRKHQVLMLFLPLTYINQFPNKNCDCFTFFLCCHHNLFFCTYSVILSDSCLNLLQKNLMCGKLEKTVIQRNPVLLTDLHNAVILCTPT